MMATATKARAPRSPQRHVDPTEIVERRRACGLTQNRLAQLARVHPMALSNVERGQRPLTEGMAKRLDAVLRGFERGLAEAEQVLRES